MANRPWLRLVVWLLLAALVAIGLALVAAGASQAQTLDPARIRVEITDKGFGDKAEGFAVEVDEGQMVELTFVFAQTIGDRHIITLKDYGLETEEIDYYHREATLKFVANKPGRFEFKCDLDCEIHHLLKAGHLVVRRAGAAAAMGAAAPSLALTPTSLSVQPSSWFVRQGPVTLRAALKDSKGTPVAKAMVGFYVDTEFAGTRSKMEIAAARTDANGVAVLEYVPTFAGRLPITARFDGMGLYGESQAALDVVALTADPAYTVAPIGLEAVRHWAPRILILVLLGVWSTFAFVVYQIFRIKTGRE